MITNLKNSGQAMLANLAAMAIVSTAVVGTAMLGQHLVREGKRSQLLNYAVTTQSEVTSALMRRDSFVGGGVAGSGDSAYANQLKQGNAPIGMPLMNDRKKVIAVVGGRMGFKITGETCQPGPDCPVSVDLNITCDKLSETQCMAAYRVAVWPDENSAQPSPLGAFFHGDPAIGGAASFQPTDYNVAISYDAGLQDDVGKCNDADDVLITGVNRSTGGVSCVKKAVTPCALGTIGSTVQAVTAADGSTHMEMVCHPLSTGKCDQDYVWQSNQMVQLDRGPASTGGVSGDVHGNCVYRWLDNGEWQKKWPIQVTSSSTTVNDQFCNSEVYTAEGDGTCSAVVDSSTPGDCPYSCNCDVDGNNCQTCHTYPESSVSTDGGSVTGPNASCTLTITDQCGSSMTAHPLWWGRCRTIQKNLVVPK